MEAECRQIENEQKKEYLQSYKKYKHKAKRLEEQLAEIRLSKISPSIIQSDMPSAHNHKDLSDYVVQCDKIITEILKARRSAIMRFTEVQQQIELLEDENEKTVLTLRYLRNYNWEKICVEMNYSWMQVHRFHARALQNFEIKDDIK